MRNLINDIVADMRIDRNVLDYYIKLYETKYGKDIKKLIKEEFPSVGDGPLVAAFHAIIQLAYGFVADSDIVSTTLRCQIV